MSRLARIAITLVASTLLLGSIGAALWQADWRYSLPTPRPAELVQPERIAPELLARLRAAAGAADSTKPLLVHVYSPACPCSRFNLDHVLELVRDFGGRSDQLALLELPEDEEAFAPRRNDELGLPELSENDGRIARALGVYATPQAVLIDRDGAVYFRGNYNLSRYCTRPDSAYARLALEALLAGRPTPALPPAATLSYGCELPNQAWGARAP
jgi:hypothetical protein